MRIACDRIFVILILDAKISLRNREETCFYDITYNENYKDYYFMNHHSLHIVDL